MDSYFSREHQSADRAPHVQSGRLGYLPLTPYPTYCPPEFSTLLEDGAPVPKKRVSSTFESVFSFNSVSKRRSTGDNEAKTRRGWHKRRIYPHFAFHGSALLLMFFASLGFWSIGKCNPIVFARAQTNWMVDNPKTTTILCSAVAALLSWFTAWLYACAVALMARKHILRRGAKLSTIEAWVKLCCQGAMVNRNRPWLSLYTVFSALLMMLLTVGFTALLTPVQVFRATPIHGTEVDFTKREFFDWYKNTQNRTVGGCMWWTHKNPLNKSAEYTFPTCPFADDTSLFLQAGRAAVEQGFGQQSITKVGDVSFKGTTGGTLPTGRNGFAAFDDLRYDNYTFLDDRGATEPYNYSTLIQGSTILVRCERKPTSPILEELLDQRNTSMSQNKHVKYTLAANLTKGRCKKNEAFNFLVPGGGNLMSFFCGPDDANEYTFFFRPFGVYQTGIRGMQLQNLTCAVKPRMTLVNSTYTSIRNEFSSRITWIAENSGLTPTDREAMDAIFQVFWFGISIRGNIVADAILSLRYQSKQNDTQPIARTFETFLRGLYEIEMTALRLYYSANFPTGSREVTGDLSFIRLGYSGMREALYALFPLAVISAMGLAYLAWGLFAGGELSRFDPTEPSNLIYASSQGGLERWFDAADVAAPPEDGRRDLKVRFGELAMGRLGLGLEVEVKRPPKGKDYVSGDA